ncbi:MAG TPA: SDR family oxidoreductase [Ramlibacter sp.]|nr:SDR family oxidoreductase [Ramlibacter sp.]
MTSQPRPGRLAGKVPVVTGAAGGIGRATVRRFLDEGARVVGVDIDAGAGAALADGLDPDRFTFLAGDHSRRDDDARVVRTALDRFGAIDVLFNNAALLRTGGFADVSDDDLDTVLGASLLGAWRMTQAALPALRASASARPDGAVVLFTASGMGLHGAAQFSAYTAAKHAVLGLMRTLALELGPQNIRVNAVCPGVTDTPMVRRGAEGLGGADKVLGDFAARSPLRRSSRPEDMANAALFLASDEARMVHSVALLVDGGNHGC